MKNNEGHKFVDNFLYTLRLLIKETTGFIRSNDPDVIAKIHRINKRINLAINSEPGMVFNKVGPYLYKYRDFIYDESTEDKLINWDFVEVKESDDKETEDISIMIISELKRCFSNMNTEQKKYYRNMVISLLDNYIEYTCIQNGV